MDLFERAREEREKREAPLAARMRPRTLEEMVGQEHILGPRTLLRRAIEADRLFSSIILWGPPGTGKTTLATIVAHTTRSHFETLSAVLAGVADVRRVVAEAKERRALYRQRTILLVDEVHRWNKAQQDALLPHVEDGTVVLMGATTENPYFEVVPPLLSRSRVFRLRPLSPGEIVLILQRALSDPERGYGGRCIEVSEEALGHLARVADGDARAALNALELAVESTPPGADGVTRIDLGVAQESIQRRALRYYKGADEHYDTISAFIKSVRGSDPHAALYWLAKMVHAGEDPRFIMRRLLVLAAEDIGLADPMGVVVAAACARALEWVGMPEAQYHLAQATIYLATAPKSNSVGGYFAALAGVQEQGQLEVPDHLKDASRDGAALGHGKGYLYPHDFPGHFVPQQYLPPGLEGATFYRPGTQGFEREIARRLAHWASRRRAERDPPGGEPGWADRGPPGEEAGWADQRPPGGEGRPGVGRGPARDGRSARTDARGDEPGP